MNKYIAEFIGTFFLVLTIGCTGIGAGAGVIAPLAIGAVLMVMVFAGGHVSGAHYNPAVSTAVYVRGKMTQEEYFAYVVIQLAAALVAGLVIIILNYDFNVASRVAGQGRMLVVEFLFTFALAWVLLNVATARGTDGH